MGKRSTEDLTGQQIGMLKVLYKATNPVQRKGYHCYYVCQCLFCGERIIRREDHLRYGRCYSCGCKRRGKSG